MTTASLPTTTPLWSCPLATARPCYINSTAISGDGSVVLAGTFFHAYGDAPAPGSPSTKDQFGVYCFARDGQGEPRWRDVFMATQGVYWVAVSQDGSTAAAGGWYDENKGFLRAYNGANGQPLFPGFYPPERVNTVALSEDGKTMVAAADQVYLFYNDFATGPVAFSLGENHYAQLVSLTADGHWCVVIDNQGMAYLLENLRGWIGAHYQCLAVPFDALHAIAIAAQGDWFALGGWTLEHELVLYLFNTQAVQNNDQTPAAAYSLTGDSVRSLALSADGSFLSVAVNQGAGGVVYALQNDDGQLSLRWQQTTEGNPNCTSVDAAAKFVAVADGFPDGAAGHFTLLDGASGVPYWAFLPGNMSWPMYLSADASGIAAGCDNGTVYYFTTPTMV